jgi:antitoxin component YwqK of YwqJK toxin-antitoxin module
MTNELKRPESIRKYYKDLEDKGHGKYIGEEYWYNGKPYTGFIIFDYYENGNIMSESEHVNGQTMGWEIEYYENGKIKKETLNYGATCVLFRDFDELGVLKKVAWLEKDLYNKVAEETGMGFLN